MKHKRGRYVVYSYPRSGLPVICRTWLGARFCAITKIILGRAERVRVVDARGGKDWVLG